LAQEFLRRGKFGQRLTGARGVRRVKGGTNKGLVQKRGIAPVDGHTLIWEGAPPGDLS